MALEYNRLYEETQMQADKIEALQQKVQGFDQLAEDEKKETIARAVYFSARLPFAEDEEAYAPATEIMNSALHQIGDRNQVGVLLSSLIALGLVEMQEMRMDGEKPVQGQEVYICIADEFLQSVNQARRNLSFITPQSDQ